MVKIINCLLLLIILFLNPVSASEKIDLTKESRIKYKWYINEEVDGKYYPKGEELPGYLEDPSRIIYGNYSNLSTSYCDYPQDKYFIEEHIDFVYQKVVSIKYIKLKHFFEKNPHIEIYSNYKKITYRIISQDNDEIIIELSKNVEPGDFFLYIESQNPYDIYLSYDKYFKQISLISLNVNNLILIPDKNWICDETIKVKEISSQPIHQNDFRKYDHLRKSCQVKEIKTFRYKLKKEYYDSKYHEYIPNYLPDVNDYIIDYQGKLPTQTIEVKNTKKEYIPIIKLEPHETIKYIKEEKEPVSKIKYLEKEVVKKIKVIPKKAYIVMISCILIIILEFIFLVKKSRLN